MPKKNNNFPEQYVLANLTNFPKPALYVDFSNNPSDMSENDATVSYLGAVTTDQDNFGPSNNLFNFANFDNSSNLDSLVNYVDVDNPLTFTDGINNSPFTVSFWYNKAISDSPDTNTEGLFSFQPANWTNGGVIYSYYTTSTKTFHIRILGSASNVYLSWSFNVSSISNPDTGWTHVSFAYDGGLIQSSMKLYINGNIVVSPSFTNLNSYSTSPKLATRLFMGSYIAGTSEADGGYSQFVWFKKELTLTQIKSLYNARLNIKDQLSGYLNNPARTVIKDQDTWSGKYPTVHRMNRKGTSGILSNILFDDTKTVKFGTRIYDNFDIKDYEAYTKEVNGDIWEVSEGVIIKREFDPNEINSASTGAVVLAGEGDIDGRWIQTKNKISMPTVYLDVLRGPYNDQGGLLGSLKLGLVEGGLNETLFIQAKTEGGSWENITIEESFIGSGVNSDLLRTGGLNAGSFLFGVNIDQQNSLTSQVKKDNRPVMSLKIPMEAFAKAGFTSEPFYLRIAQSQVNSASRNVWAIGKIDIISRDEQVTYPALNKGVTADLFHLSQKIASPNIVSYLTTTGSAIEGITDSEYSFVDSSLEQKSTPFDESLVTDYKNNEFHRAGTDPNVLPGYDSQLLSKTSFQIDLSPSEEIDVGYNTLQTSPNRDTSGNGQMLMVYWNKNSKTWQKVGKPMGVGLNNFSSPTIDTFLGVMTASAVGFGPQLLAIGSSSTGLPGGELNVFSADALSLAHKPIQDFSFPYGAQYHATGSQFVKAKDLGITKPFLLEKIKVSFDINLELPKTGDTVFSSYSSGFQQQYMVTNNNPSSRQSISGWQSIVPTFFILKQQKGNFNRLKRIRVGDGYSEGEYTEYYFREKIPTRQAIVSGSLEATYVDTSRELITYTQPHFCFQRSNFDVAGNLNLDLRELPSHGYPGDKFIYVDTGVPASSVISYTGSNITVSDEVKNTSKYDSITSVRVNPTAATNQDGIFVQKDNVSRGYSDLDSSKSPVNSFASFVPSEPYSIPSFAPAINPTSVVTPTHQTITVTSPYLVQPEDELIFGWQYPINNNMVNTHPSTDANGFFKMTLFGNSKLTLFGSQVKNNKEFHEGLNQNLTSNAIHETIGSEPVIDQWQISSRNEMTGSFLDQFMFADSFFTEPDSGAAVQGLILGKLLLDKKIDNNVDTEFQTYLHEGGNNPVKRVNSGLDFSTYVARINSWSVLGSAGLLTGVGGIDNYDGPPSPGHSFVPQIQRFTSAYDRKRVYVDSNIANGSEVGLFYGSGQNYTYLKKDYLSDSTGNALVKMGGNTKDYYNYKHYGHLADNMRQGLDGNFETNLTIQNRNNDAASFVVTSPTVKTQFVSSEYDNADLNFRIFKKTKPDDINGSSYISYQSSNLDEFSRSFKPFYDDGIVLNREYGEDTITVTI